MTLTYEDGKKLSSLGLWLGVFVLCCLWTAIQPQAANAQISRVKRVDGASTSVGKFTYLYNVSVDQAGNVYVADTGNHRIVKLDPTGNPIAVFGKQGTGPGEFMWPMAVVVDRKGNMYVADNVNHRVQKLSSEGSFIWQVGGDVVASSNGATEQPLIDSPFGLALDSEGSLYVADAMLHRIVKLNPDGNLITRWGEFGTEPGQMRYPHSVAVDKAGNVYVSDFVNHRIQKFTSDGKFLAAWGGPGTAEGQFQDPWGVAVDNKNRVWVADLSNHRIQVFNKKGKLQFSFGSFSTDPDESDQFNYPKGIAFGPGGAIWIAHTGVSAVDLYRLDSK